MLDDNKLTTITLIIENKAWNLDNKMSRRRLGRLISESIDMFEGRVQSFLEDMIGLDLREEADRQTFYLFLKSGL